MSRKIALQQRLLRLFPHWGAAQLEFEDDDASLGSVEAMVQHAEAEQSITRRTSEVEAAASEYSAEEHRLQTILQHAGITPAMLSPEAQEHLSWAAAEASSLGLARSSDLSILAAWVLLNQEQAETAMKQEDRAAQNEEQLRAIAATTSAIAGLRKQLSQASAALAADAPEMERVQGTVPGLVDKTRKYEYNAGNIQRALHKIGLTPELHHQALVEQQAERDRLHVELDNALLRLAACHGLPPTLRGAEAALRRLENECHDARAELDKSLVEGD